MIISLYLEDRIVKFKLPTIVSGSYSFDFEENEGNLINIDGIDGKWILYETDDSKILDYDHYLESVELLPNNFYTLLREDKQYLIYVYSVNDTNMLAYGYDNTSNIVITSDGTGTFNYKCPYLDNRKVTINFSNTITISNPNNCNVYVNKFRMAYESYTLKAGDTIELYGLRIIILSKLLLINNLFDKLYVDVPKSSLKSRDFIKEEDPEDITVKNVDLYTEDNYFSKSPRLRRTIENKKVNLSPPPQETEEKELPLLLTVGPMLTMGITSITMVFNQIVKITNHEATVKSAWPQLLSGGVMLLSTFFWPTITQQYNKRVQKRKSKELRKKYMNYLDTKRKELQEEAQTQKVINIENLITIEDCVEILKRKNVNFWNKRNDQNDFLTARIGVGKSKLDVDIGYSEEDFKLDENNLRDEADKLVEEFKYIENVPVAYSFFDSVVTDIMGKTYVSTNFLNNILLQLLTFYSYEDLTLVVFTSEAHEKNWEYIKYLNHNFSRQKDFRFFASNQEEAKILTEYLEYEFANRVNVEQEEFKPHYLIIVDGYDNVKHFDLINNIAECEKKIGMSVVILETSLGKLPSKCSNFIILEKDSGTILKNTFDSQEQIKFTPEIHYNLNMMSVSKLISNTPIEFEEGFAQLPESISFIEMEKVGKVEQLNILNRWNSNDSTKSLRAEVGVDQNGELMYLDLHEKAHGPHGLIAGTTGSGKSEFIITYILSMAVNYSPDDVSFILIDYKGGGLALAFENKLTGVTLPHLAGTITNLDKAEMNRTLVSIDSEVKRRQQKFNEARDKLNESTIDIYKYQRFYKEGRLEEAIPHLFIICDEFAELKSQQPDFMDNLISVARIGRSLGVHLILATQKPSGVVNDQIWSNSKFKVCLKVQDEADSREMLKKPDAAHLKEAGRFFLQVGYDEYYALGQSAWCGAKYYPYDKVIKQVDKSVNFINNYGAFIKSIQATKNIRVEPQGEQLAAIMHNIIEVSQMTGAKAQKLWLDNVSSIISCETLEKKYNYSVNPLDKSVYIGEYDAPEKQEQGVVNYNFINDGNTIVYGNDSSEVEMLLNTLVYQTSNHFSPSEVNFYIVDYGSESFRKYLPLPHVGGVIFQGEDEEFNNLIRMIKNDIQERKSLFVDYGGQYLNYIKNNEKKIPIKVIIINNYDAVYGSHQDLYEIMPDIIRDSERYGVVFWLTGSSTNSVNSKVTTLVKNMYAFKLKDISDYQMVFGKKLSILPAEIPGRGVLKHDILHNFQVASIIDDYENVDEYLINYIKEKKQASKQEAYKIPILPDKVRLNNIKESIDSLNSIPIGISKAGLEVINYDFTENVGNIISSNKLPNTEIFSKSLLTIYSYFKGAFVVVFDPLKMIEDVGSKFSNYFTTNFDSVLDSIEKIIDKYIETKSNMSGIIYIQGFTKMLNKLQDKTKMGNLVEKLKKYEKIQVIAVDGANQLKTVAYESWFTQNFSVNDGIWIGKGLSDQGVLRVGTISKIMTLDYKNDMGFVVGESSANLIKLIDLVSPDDEK